jgi:glycosyltransferase involved in cell wall biosynthesis
LKNFSSYLCFKKVIKIPQMGHALISIVVPTLNEEKYLPRLLQSLRQQTCTDFEVIVADAESGDATRTMAIEYGCRVVPGGRIAQGRNAGARQARGEYLLFLDADVTVAPTFLEELMRQVRRRQLEAASGFITPDSRKLLDKLMVSTSNLWHFTIQLCYPHASGFYILARKTLHEAIGGFDEELFLTEDHDYVIRAARRGKFRYLWKPRVRFSVRRFDKEGRLKLIGKFLVLEIYMLFKRVRRPSEKSLYFSTTMNGTIGGLEWRQTGSIPAPDLNDPGSEP